MSFIFVTIVGCIYEINSACSQVPNLASHGGFERMKTDTVSEQRDLDFVMMCGIGCWVIWTIERLE